MLSELQIGVEYYWKRTDGWDWFGTQRWWTVFIEVSGLNGAGGYWVYERWRWNGSSSNLITKLLTLSWEESQKMTEEIIAANPTLFKIQGE